MSEGEVTELRLAPESIEALALRLAELIGEGPTTEPARDKDMISAAEVSQRWGVSRRWVYAHREELGAVPIGDGPRPRLRFDPRVVAARLGSPDGRPRPARPDRRRSTWISTSRRSDSLSSRTRANVGEARRNSAEGDAGTVPPARRPDGGAGPRLLRAGPIVAARCADAVEEGGSRR